MKQAFLCRIALHHAGAFMLVNLKSIIGYSAFIKARCVNSSMIQSLEAYRRIFLRRNAKGLNDRTSKDKVEKWIVLRSHSVEIELVEKRRRFY